MKEYSVNIRYAHSDDEWEQADNADWYGTWSEAFEEAEEAFKSRDVEEVMIAVWEDGEVEDSPLRMVREGGSVNQYVNGERLWA